MDISHFQSMLSPVGVSVLVALIIAVYLSLVVYNVYLFSIIVISILVGYIVYISLRSCGGEKNYVPTK